MAKKIDLPKEEVIYLYIKKNNKEENLITLCNFCNSSVNSKREDWINYFQNKIKSTS